MLLNHWLKNKNVQGSLVGLVVALFSLLLWLTPAFDGWENVTWNWRVRTLAKPSDSTDQIKVILIDQNSLDWASSQLGLSWPWPREIYGAIVDFCRRGGARVIAFDMLYSEPSSYMVADDVSFGDAIARSNNVVTAFFMGDQAGQTSVWPSHLPRPPVHIEGCEEWLLRHPKARLTEKAATFPVTEIARPAALLASVKESPDADGAFRRSSPFRLFDQATVPLLGLSAYLAGELTPPYVLSLEDRELKIGSMRIPLDTRGQAILRFRGPSGAHELLSAAAIIQSELRIREGGQPVVEPEELRDTYVFFGVSAPGLKDLRPTPVSGDYPGVEIHATFLDNLLAQDFMREPSALIIIISTMLLSVLSGLAIMRSATVGLSLAWGVLLAAIPFAAGFYLYTLGWWWPVMVQEIAVLASLGIAEVVNYATEGRQKRFIKNAFRQYLSGDVIEQIIANPGALKLGGEKRELSIFFSDLQGFSAISEKLGPEGLTALLNDYLTDMSDIIMEEGGTVDKYEGDAIIAFWNAPLPQDDHAIRACRTALRCQRKLGERRQEFKDRTGVDLFMRIGIHTGDVVVGNMGSHNRFNYTVLGDAANLASRLEGANKPFGTYLMVSEVTWAQARSGGFHAREIGSIMVVGRKAPVKVFEVLGLPGEREPDIIAPWARAMLSVRAGQWGEARDLFSAIPDDPLAIKYRDQCARILNNEISGWDGIWKLTEK